MHGQRSTSVWILEHAVVSSAGGVKSKEHVYASADRCNQSPVTREVDFPQTEPPDLTNRTCSDGSERNVRRFVLLCRVDAFQRAKILLGLVRDEWSFGGSGEEVTFVGKDPYMGPVHATSRAAATPPVFGQVAESPSVTRTLGLSLFRGAGKGADTRVWVHGTIRRTDSWSTYGNTSKHIPHSCRFHSNVWSRSRSAACEQGDDCNPGLWQRRAC